MYHFCTITTTDHLYKTLALYDSLNGKGNEIVFHILCIDGQHTYAPAANIKYYSMADISILPVAGSILSKYSKSTDRLRWSMKPVFLHFLLDRVCDKIIYTDNDIYFFEDPSFIFGLLDSYDFLLTPHHYPRDPGRDQNWLEANYRVGLYNAGFIGANKNARADMIWWASCCAYRCEKNALRGTFDDQKYLDLIPVINEKAYIMRHKGCNVAEWNRIVIPRTKQDGKVFLDGTYPLIFIHFNGTTIRAIATGEEPLLKDCLDEYIEALAKHNPEVEIKHLYKMPGLPERIKYRIWKMATDIGF